MTGADYLEHTLLFGALQRYLKDRRTPLRVLDLGCGDCQNLAKLVKDLPEGTIASYTGEKFQLLLSGRALHNVQPDQLGGYGVRGRSLKGKQTFPCKKC